MSSSTDLIKAVMGMDFSPISVPVDQGVAVISIDFDLDNRESEVSVSERGEERPDGGWESVELMDGLSEASFRFAAYDEKEEGCPGITVSMSFFHAENEDTGRAFHSNARMPLTRKDLEKLHTAIGMALAIGAGS